MLSDEIRQKGIRLGPWSVGDTWSRKISEVKKHQFSDSGQPYENGNLISLSSWQCTQCNSSTSNKPCPATHHHSAAGLDHHLVAYTPQ